MSQSADQLPPHDAEAEGGAIACIMAAGGDQASKWASSLRLNDFYDQRNREVFIAIKDLDASDSGLDEISVLDWLKDKGVLKKYDQLQSYVVGLNATIPSTAAFDSYREIVLEFSLRRNILRDATKLAASASDRSQPVEALSDLSKTLVSGYVRKEESSWQLCDVADTMEKVLPEPTQIIQGLLCANSKLVVGGSSKTYKSWLLTDMGLSLSVGSHCLGRECKPLRVLYVNLELKETTFERRLQTIIHAKGIKLDRDRFHFLSLRGKLAGMSIQAIIDRILSFLIQIGAEVALLDPLYKLNTEGEENSAKDQTLFFNQLDRITTEGNSAVIAADHFGKGNQSEKDPLDAIRGSSAKGGDLDAALILRKHSQDGSFSVDVVHRELPPVEPFVLTWQFPLFHVDQDLDASDMKKPGGKPQHDPIHLLSFIRNTSKENPISTTDWADLANVSRTTLGTYLTNLREKGYISTIGSGPNLRKYITISGIQALNGH